MRITSDFKKKFLSKKIFLQNTDKTVLFALISTTISARKSQ